VVGVALLVPVGSDCLVVADLQGMLTLPCGPVHDGQTLQEAAHRILCGPAGDLQLLRHVAVDWVQTRRRKVITHLLAVLSATPDTVERLIYRDPRATVRVMPTLRLLDQVQPTTRTRIVVGLHALATGETFSIEGGEVQAEPPTKVPV
jgi:hypothetical protein